MLSTLSLPSSISNPSTASRSLCRILQLLLLCSTALQARASMGEGYDVPTVEVKQGLMMGSAMKTVGGRSVASYRGIPYARPPLGPLRFKAPEPLDGWEGVLDAREDPPPCIQKDLIFDMNAPIIGQEDCLFLNVYVPMDILRSFKESEIGDEFSKLPVMVYFHGGGWLCGSGSDFNFGPDLLLDEDVILVTMNYRLSAFGFLSTGDNASPGNYALKDQNLALKWIKENIASFGGDNKRVTIFGQSAGGASVNYHLLSPLSKGLFQNAISQSGISLAPWASPKDAPSYAKTLAGYLNCTTNGGSQEMVDCLREKNATEIAMQFGRFIKWDIDPLVVFGPTIEREDNDEKPFISKHPYQLMKDGQFNQVNWMTGLAQDDGCIRTANILSDEKKVKDINDGFADFVGPLTLRIEETAKDPKEIAQKIRQFYFRSEEIGIDTHKELTKMYNDRLSLHPIIFAVDLMMSAPNKLPAIFFFQFSHRGQYSLLDMIPVINKTSNSLIDMGVSHCDDLIYLFPMRDFVRGPLQGDDIQVSKMMVKLWTEFAKEGNPTPSLSHLIPTRWETVNPQEIKFLEIGSSSASLKMVPLSREFYESYNFWKLLGLNENKTYNIMTEKDEF